MRIAVCVLAACCAAGGAEQTPAGGTAALTPQDVLMWQAGAPGPGHAVEFIRTELSYDGRVVKGAPYTAEAVNESVQVLADGNRITRRNTAQIARDGEGRTRRHEKISAVGPWPSEAHEMIILNDPVAMATYFLDPKARTARKLPLPEARAGNRPGEVVFHGRSAEGGRVEEREIRIATAAAPAHTSNEKTEFLGRRMVEGVLADGTRSVTVIPAGELGNERPIEIVTERWHSPELQVTVMSKRSDPRFGETNYRLTNIQRGEPPRTLFEVPAGYKLEDAGQRLLLLHRETREK